MALLYLAEAYVDTIKRAVNLGYAKTGDVVSLAFSALKEASHSAVHWKLLLVFLSER